MEDLTCPYLSIQEGGPAFQWEENDRAKAGLEAWEKLLKSIGSHGSIFISSAPPKKKG